MNEHGATAGSIAGAYSREAATDLAGRIRDTMQRPARVAFAFVTPDYLPHMDELTEILRVDGHILDVVGCTAEAMVAGADECPKTPGVSLLALSCEAGDPLDLGSGQPLSIADDTTASIVLGNPFEFAADEWLHAWNERFPGAPCVGALASGGTEERVGTFLNGRAVEGVAVPLLGRTDVLPVVSQGCRPIGEPLTVTRAEHNVLYALGSQPAYAALESAFQSLSDAEKSNARGNLFAGIAGTEYVDEFKPGDFLIRNILGADPDSGAVVIGGIPRIGQTLQYQLRDVGAARDDFDRVIASLQIAGRRPFASLLFSCIGRSESFFGEPGFDAGRIVRATGGRPAAGFFGSGEIGPVAGKSALHSYTACAAIFVEKPE